MHQEREERLKATRNGLVERRICNLVVVWRGVFQWFGQEWSSLVKVRLEMFE